MENALPRLDSNQDQQDQNLLCYRYTTGYLSGGTAQLADYRPIRRGKSAPAPARLVYPLGTVPEPLDEAPYKRKPDMLRAGAALSRLGRQGNRPSQAGGLLDLLDQHVPT